MNIVLLVSFSNMTNMYTSNTTVLKLSHYDLCLLKILLFSKNALKCGIHNVKKKFYFK